MSKYSTNIRPYVESELVKASIEMKSGKPGRAFAHLENAHVLGQENTYLHVKAHVHMLQWAIHQRSAGEILGQVLRIVGAATKTAFGLVPVGNTGGTNVSPFKSMPLRPEHEDVIVHAKMDS